MTLGCHSPVATPAAGEAPPGQQNVWQMINCHVLTAAGSNVMAGGTWVPDTKLSWARVGRDTGSIGGNGMMEIVLKWSERVWPWTSSAWRSRDGAAPPRQGVYNQENAKPTLTSNDYHLLFIYHRIRALPLTNQANLTSHANNQKLHATYSANNLLNLTPLISLVCAYAGTEFQSRHEEVRSNN